jgi:hypothetical protein
VEFVLHVEIEVEMHMLFGRDDCLTHTKPPRFPGYLRGSEADAEIAEKPRISGSKAARAAQDSLHCPDGNSRHTRQKDQRREQPAQQQNAEHQSQ